MRYTTVLFLLMSVTAVGQSVRYDSVRNYTYTSESVLLKRSSTGNSRMIFTIGQKGKGFKSGRYTFGYINWDISESNILPKWSEPADNMLPPRRFDYDSDMYVVGYNEEPTERGAMRATIEIDSVKTEFETPTYDLWWNGEEFLTSHDRYFTTYQYTSFEMKDADFWKRLLNKKHIKIDVGAFQGYLPNSAHREFRNLLLEVEDQVIANR